MIGNFIRSKSKMIFLEEISLPTVSILSVILGSGPCHRHSFSKRCNYRTATNFWQYYKNLRCCHTSFNYIITGFILINIYLLVIFMYSGNNFLVSTFTVTFTSSGLITSASTASSQTQDGGAITLIDKILIRFHIFIIFTVINSFSSFTYTNNQLFCKLFQMLVQ